MSPATPPAPNTRALLRDETLYPGLQVLAELGPCGGKCDHGFQVAELVASIVASPLEDHSIDACAVALPYCECHTDRWFLPWQDRPTEYDPTTNTFSSRGPKARAEETERDVAKLREEVKALRERVQELEAELAAR